MLHLEPFDAQTEKGRQVRVVGITDRPGAEPQFVALDVDDDDKIRPVLLDFVEPCGTSR
ncbi:hypothetical protein GCM10011499_16400 [Pelagibacterium lentulum]|uniref:Uncharacterized protein n=2 Tax=Pelagibacterium lentulum TaxID=2029865 RepID=A0A916RB53_9HYPH|nr:hypothetical protein GCM10011499_16400 [Pelagibacterium lentulum]